LMPARITPKREVRLYLAEWRKHRGLTQQQLAERLGCEVMTVSRWERHETAIATDTIAALAEVLGDDLEPLDLFSHPDGPNHAQEQEVDPARTAPTLYLAEWREHRKLTQQQLADQLGSSGVTVSRWETQQREPSLSTQKAIAEVLDIELADLHRHPDEPNADALLRGQPQEVVDLVLKLIVAVISPMNSTPKGKQHRRPHFIPEWAERRGLAQGGLANLLGADKSVISRWYGGATPGEEWQTKLADLFGCDREGLFRHPDEEWLTKFFRDRSADEVDRMKQMLEAAFPPKSKGN
jgi:transcriptional regulator with XRE-family HTH domain